MTSQQSLVKIIIITALIALGIGFAVWLAAPAAENNTAQLSSGLSGELIVEETAFDFGQISMAKGKVKHEFKLKNKGNTPVAITKLYTSCMCTTASLIIEKSRRGPFGMLGHGFIPKFKEVIESGQEFSVEVVFDPAAHGPAGVGKVERAIYLEQESGERLELIITATVIP
ncbi:MAG: DUF1573 domain-containing protein [Candidatus Paceibacteria bacterium]